jgi:hypothetical protein
MRTDKQHSRTWRTGSKWGRRRRRRKRRRKRRRWRRRRSANLRSKP